ncbi:YbaB/EbfC family nucleoid-associated protein [Glycomyces sp. TRM65418]|uniref:YbaB/EbfC family nucleoid-associated protein n=1 Tax=Glycomyces sp. TRM65418 TaxID=2867006 RepID=UPI001CE6EAF2|nr:YbaB/EbfC family nucleoid-associated protein [Glycomyces sp. TRM65418]MCC3762680.1 YbaB/EbfC family nucleoid-associated protein [Glycomyces sp. TRM65418]QZD56715.1 YbaB/EbfC family nucleoid-associated protein [Glycomyces sp. TRM65418]
MTIPDPRGLTGPLDEVMAAARRVQDIQQGQSEAEPITVEAAEGTVSVTVKAPGTAEVSIRPAAMRLGSEALSEQVSLAVNEAYAALREQAGAGAAVDLEELNEQLAEIQRDSAARLSSFLDGIMSAHSRAEQREDR